MQEEEGIRSCQVRRGQREGEMLDASSSAAPLPQPQPQPPPWWKLWAFIAVLALDLVTSLMLLTPLIPRVRKAEDVEQHYSLHGSLWDLSLLSILRVLSALLAISISYHRLQAPPVSPFNPYKENGERKSKEELEVEALEEPFIPQLKRLVQRMPFVCEFFVLVTGILISLKCLTRLNVEIGVFDDAQPKHPVFWIALCLTGLLSLVETINIDSIEKLAGELGRRRRLELGEQGSSSWAERISESLTQPLLSRVNSEADVRDANDEEQGLIARNKQSQDETARGFSEIGADAEYSAKWSDLLMVCEQDKYLIMVACVFLLGAAVAQVYVPKLTGEILDTLVAHSSDNTPDDDDGHHGSIVHIPGFVKKIELLVLVSIFGGIFSGIRGAIFTLIGARVNVRLRIKLMDSLLSQDIGFFDTTRTGDITSRLSSDTTLVGSSLTTNVNIFLRSTVRAIGVLVFMFVISWQLSVMAFITIPAVSVLSRWYGRYIRRLTKLQQKKLAEGNNVSESSISSMPTVRAFGAESVELKEFEDCMQNYLILNVKAAIATLGYSTCLNSLPQLAKALVLFYGGLMVQTDGPDHMTGGQLVSFILYVSSLSESFNSLGGIYASLVRAVGASDKVFELLNRKPRLTEPSHIDEEKVEQAVANKKKHLLGVESTKVAEQRAAGLYPENCDGEITLKDVEFRYPARPHSVVLNNMDMTIPAGSICALVGVSGSGKSSIVKLIQHLYEPSQGQVCIDGIPVHELSADWLCRNVAVVSQEPTLFARSVKRNIMYGLEGTDFEPSQKDIEEAARLANAAPFIEALPRGYDSEVGERGIQLSGGQKQRLAIARALVRKPRILLLDEATSALDSESEHVVQEAIDDMINGQRSLNGDPSRSMTIVTVAHRLSTVIRSDTIFVIEKGKLKEQGSHDELIAKEDGVYSALVRRQLGRMDR